jgi:hypothetical protein
MDPLQIAQLLMSYYLRGNHELMHVSTNLETECEDNEVRLQILLSIYTEMHNIWYEHPEVTEEVFLDMINNGFKTLGYKVHITDPNTLVIPINEIVHYASIKPDGSMSLNPFHPYHIADLIRQRGSEVPDCYKILLDDISQLPYIATFHYYSSGSLDIVSFERLKG